VRVIQVLICDDHQIVRQGIKQILADAATSPLAGEAASGPEALARVRGRHRRGAAGHRHAAARRAGRAEAAAAEFPRLPVLMLSTYPDRQYAVRSLKLGAAGYLNKSADSEQLIEAIRRVAGGRLFITPAWPSRLAVARWWAGWPQRRRPEPLHERLSQREYQVFRLLAGAAAWARSPSSWRCRRTRSAPTAHASWTKTGVRNDVELALYAVRCRTRAQHAVRHGPLHCRHRAVGRRHRHHQLGGQGPDELRRQLHRVQGRLQPAREVSV
jgi:two-component system invasion response regulator UvrY